MRQTDADFLLDMLRETPNEFVSQAEILRRSQADRGCGLTVHSRIAELRSRGYNIPPALRVRNDNGRVISYYRIVPPLRAAGSSAMSTSTSRVDGRSGCSERSGRALARPDESDQAEPGWHEAESEGPAPPALFELPTDRKPPWA
jgi:hypothetical protein